MKTKTLILQPTKENIALCAEELRNGGLVAFPTETVYALGAVATNAVAVEKVFEVKGRPSDKPLIVAVARKSDIDNVVKAVPQKARVLIDKFMPGALTLVMKKAECIPSVVTACGDSVAVRIPNNEIALKLIELSDSPVVVPSANTSEKASPTLAEHVKDDLEGKIRYILDGGASEIGIESTIVDVRCDPPVILRVGGVTVEQIESAIGHVETKREDVKLSGYMPSAELMFAAYCDGMERNITAKYDEITARGKSAVICCLDNNVGLYNGRTVMTVGKDYTEYAHNLFALLRKADAEHFDAVIAEGVNPSGIGSSLIARLIKLSGGYII
ncbi:MAG: threonylcarbamoyl-AMP synthase [Clostridiales bacterium]|nr:threonylcarbamoyl-AMP synthase [Clostridiales bacterium]